jgi:allantoicase
LPFEIIIALKEEAKIERISIKSIEIYSSVVKSFILEGALNQDEDEPGESNIWFKLLSAEAKNTGAEQQFRTKNKAVRFLRLRILSKHGDWKYFTMTQLKVYGSGLFTEALIDYQTVQNNTS